MKIHILPLICCLCIGSMPKALADIDKVYHPYVEPLEHEIEFRLTASQDQLDKYQKRFKTGYGQAISNNVLLEGYLIGRQFAGNTAEEEAYELEAIWQITDQGHYWADYGLLIEAEREINNNISEVGITLLAEKEFQDTSLTLNLAFSYEFGAGIDNEYDRKLRGQWRYRYNPRLQPALEVYLDEYDKAAGPTLIGTERFSKGSKLKWELGWLFALDDLTPDSSIKFSLEYEF